MNGYRVQGEGLFSDSPSYILSSQILLLLHRLRFILNSEIGA